MPAPRPGVDIKNFVFSIPGIKFEFHFRHAIEPDTFQKLSPGRLYGGLLGAIVYMVARDQFSGINPQYWYFWIGTLLIAVVMFLPNGILGGLGRLAPTVWRRA